MYFVCEHLSFVFHLCAGEKKLIEEEIYKIRGLLKIKENAHFTYRGFQSNS